MFFLKSCHAAVTLNGIQPPFCYCHSGIRAEASLSCPWLVLTVLLSQFFFFFLISAASKLMSQSGLNSKPACEYDEVEKEETNPRKLQEWNNQKT